MTLGAMLLAGLSLSTGGQFSPSASPQVPPPYRTIVEREVRASMRTPDKVSLQWGVDPTPGWAAMKGRPRADGLLGCVVVIGKNTGGSAVEDRIYLVYVFNDVTEKVAGQIFTLNQLNKARARHMGKWFSRDPGCPVS